MNDTVLAAIVSPAIALLGVFMTLWMSQRQLKITLQEERKKSKEERDFAAKHKAMLAAVESVIRFYYYYLSLPDKELPTDGTVPCEVAEMGVALSSLHFYCDIETIKRSVILSEVLSDAQARALKAKIPALFIAGDIKRIDIWISNLEAANKQIQQEIVAMLSFSPLDSNLVSRKQKLEVNSKSIYDLQLKRDGLLKAKYDATENCRDVIKGDLRAVHESLRDVLLEARRELSFPIDERAYATLINQSTDKAIVSIENLYNELRTQVRKKLEQL